MLSSVPSDSSSKLIARTSPKFQHRDWKIFVFHVDGIQDVGPQCRKHRALCFDIDKLTDEGNAGWKGPNDKNKELQV